MVLSRDEKKLRPKAIQIKQEKEQILNALVRHDFHVQDACRDTGINYNRYYKWLREDPAFKEKRDLVRTAMLHGLEHDIFAMAKGTHPKLDNTAVNRSIRFLLSKLHPDYRDKSEVSVTGQVTHTMMSEFDSWSEEKLIRFINTGQEIEDVEYEEVEGASGDETGQ